MPGLSYLPQQDFSAGMFRSVARHRIPENGVWDLVNSLVDEDGSTYKRGGAEYLSTANFGTTGLKALWELQLPVGARSMFANTADFGVLDAAEAPVNLGGAGLAAPKAAAVLGGIAFIGGGALYGGSRKTADYNTGTVTTTLGSKIVTGSGTTWNTLVDAGMLFHVGSERFYPVESIDSTTQITLKDPYEGVTGAGKTYTLAVLGAASGGPYKTSEIYAVVANRLLAPAGQKLPFSNGPSPTGILRPHVFTATDFHEFPATILGIGVVRDKAIVFTTAGSWVVSNMAFDLTDDAGNVQQRVEKLTDEMVLWGHEGIAQWRGQCVVPGTEDVWLMDGISQPTKISVSISPMIRDYVAAGYHVGLATVFKSHYFLPVLDSGNAVQDVLVCRLDRPVRTPQGTVFPWTHLQSFGGNVSSFSVRVSSGAARQPELLAGSNATGSRVLKMTGIFTPSAARKLEADGTKVAWRLTTRDFPTGSGNENLVRKLRARYELLDAAADNPTIQAYVSVGRLQGAASFWGTGKWGTAFWASSDSSTEVLLAGSAPEDDGRHVWTWPHQVRTRFIRYRLQSDEPTSKLALRSLELGVRQSGRA